MKIIRKSIGRLLGEVARAFSQRDALVHTECGIRYDYAHLLQLVERVALGFRRAGLEKGDRVALWGENIAEWILSFLGLASMGAITVPIDPAAPKDTLYFILQQAQCRALIFSAPGGDKNRQAAAQAAKTDLPALEQVFVVADTARRGMTRWSELLQQDRDATAKNQAAAAPQVRAEDPVAIMYTSGTTGRPKGVVLNHLGLVNKSMFATERQGIRAGDRLCLFFPLFHMFGNTCIALAGLLRGAALIMPCRNFDPVRILRTIPQEKCTAIYGSPSMLIALVDHPEFQKSSWTSLTKGIIGGAPCPMELMRRIVADIGVSGITVAYGITETSSWITMTHPDDPIELRVSTIGTPLPCNEVKIVEPASGQPLGPGRPGELCTRGFLMQEYYKMPAATAAAIDREGWFHTGDLGEMDVQGYVKITGRLKDVIVRNGVEIYPVEVEEAIYRLAEVSEAQVFGFPHPAKGQQVAAWVKLKKGCRLSLDALAAHVGSCLPADKIPQHYKIVNGFPMTASGKVQKFRLAQMAAEEYSQGS